MRRQPTLLTLLLCLGLTFGSRRTRPTTTTTPTGPTTTPTPTIPAVPGGSFLFTIPREITAKTSETFCLTLRNPPAAGVDFTISLQDAKRDAAVVYKTKEEVMTSAGRRCMDLEIPDITDRSPVVRVRGVARDGDRSVIFDKTSHLYLKLQHEVTFIETDKPVYKPGDSVRMRLMTIDTKLKPVADVIEEIWVENPGGVRMEQWRNVTKELGLASLEMKLSKEPVLGPWTIKGKVGGNRVQQYFIVDEYVLPKYEVTITTPGFALLIDETISGRVCAKYTYGKRVQGRVQVRSQLEGGYGRNAITEPQEVRGDLGEDGCYDYTLPSAYIRKLRNEWGRTVKVIALITEKGTGVKMNKTAPAMKITRSPLNIAVQEMKNGFKPFMGGQVVEVKVTTAHDQPAPGEIVEVTFNKAYTTHPYGIDEDQRLLDNYTDVSGPDGRLTVPIDRNLTGRKAIFITAKAKTFRGGTPLGDEKKYSEIYDTGTFTYERRVIYGAQDSKTVKAWFSPSKSFIKIGHIASALLCNQVQDIEVELTGEPDILQNKIYWSVVARGKIVAEGAKMIDPSSLVLQTHDDVTVWSFSLPLQVDVAFAPGFKLLVYYVRNDGEIVSDESAFATQKCLPHDVSVTFDKNQKLPGEKTIMTLKAAPDSLCGFSIVDKSVTLMGDGNTLDKSRLFSWLKKSEISDKHFNSEDRHYCVKKLKKEEDLGGTPTPSGPEVIRMNGRPREVRSIWNPWFTIRSTMHDAIKAFRDAGILTLTDMVMETRPCIKEEHISYASGGGRPAPLYDYDNEVDYDMNYEDSPIIAKSVGASMDDVDGQPKPPKQPKKLQEAQIRNFFPETWLWNLERIPSSGSLVFKKSVPHTITEWKAGAVCANQDLGVGIADVQSLVVFQPFFASASLPYSVIKGEKIPLKISVFNYLEECISIHLQLIKIKGIFKAVGSKQHEFCLCSQNSTTVEFMVNPNKIGKINVTVSAEALKSGLGSCPRGSVMSAEARGVKDVIIKELLVEPEGIEVEANFGQFVCLDPQEEAVFEEEVTLKFQRKTYVKNSARLRVTAIGDVLGPALDGLDDLLRLPTGCGEQNMLKFAPNIFILDYLLATNQDNQDIKQKAIEFMKTGYQRELTYRHTDGSYSAFGNSDSSGSLWLTAFVVKCFGQARRFIEIDQTDLDLSLKWLKKSQTKEGEFPTIGRILHKAMKGGLEKDGSGVGLTAYTLTALLEAGVPPTDAAVTSGLQFVLRSNLQDLDTYSLLLLANVLIDVENPRLSDVLAVIESRKKSQLGGSYWSDNAEGSPVTASDIEMTAYGLLVYTKKQDIDSAVESVRWLTQQRNSKGGFLSTQDTVVALQALAKISALLVDRSGSLKVKWEGHQQQKEFRLNEGNRLLLQRADMKFNQDDPRQQKLKVRVTAESAGCAMVQATLKYNLKKPPPEQKLLGQKKFVVKHVVEKMRGKSDHCKWRRLNTCVTWGDDSNSGMIVAEVKMVSGWIPDKDSLKEAKKQHPKLKRFDVDARLISLYLDDLEPQKETCFSYVIELQTKVGNPKPGLVKVYDYYEPEIVVDKKYKIKVYCGTKEELPYDEPESRAGDVRQRRVQDGFRHGLFDPEFDFSTCPDCSNSDFKSSFCNATQVLSVTYLDDDRLRIYKEHRQNTTVSNSDVELKIGRNCNCRHLRRPHLGQHLLLMFLDEDFDVSDSLTSVELDDDVIVFRVGNDDAYQTCRRQQAVCPPISGMLPSTLISQASESCPSIGL